MDSASPQDSQPDVELEAPAPSPGTRRWLLAALAGTVALAVAVGGGWLLVRNMSGSDTKDASARVETAYTAPAEPSATASPSPSASPEPSPEPTPSASPSAKPSPSASASKRPEPPGTPCKRQGVLASDAEVRAALNQAADRMYFPEKAPFKVPRNLVYAIAYMESGWNSDVISCDGGVGLMQLMPDTVSHMNERINERPLSPYNYKENATLGVQYLSWLTKYFVENNPAVFPKYDLTDKRLLTAVIAAYQSGQSSVTINGGQVTVRNPQYVEAVMALMTSCPCL
ncbi:transglycosylase SLT domain-containing protein [Longispora albida]|uniref:transglycosylase SLT domain-containing protein n=1 Tax=Longispora albida TaxID=203523 RepID=UPI0003675352|nr:transglycosylase SLT domain-containing protein [Longispora albida]